MHADHPDVLVAARKECPLIVGLGEDETFVASAIPAFLAETRTALLDRERRDRHDHRRRREITDAEGNPVEPRASRRSPGTRTPPRRAATTTFMMKEIHEQPDAVAETITDRLPRLDSVDLSEIELDTSSSAQHRPDRHRRLRHLATTRAWSAATRSSSGRGSRSRWTSPPSTATATPSCARTTWSSASPSRARRPTPSPRCASPARAAPRCWRSPT